MSKDICDRCGKPIFGIRIQIGNIGLCNKCYNELSAQQYQERLKREKNIAEYVKRSWR